MDKQFWHAIRENRYSVPEGHTAAELTEELLEYVGSPDPELRDAISYETFANWLDKRQYSPEQIRTYIPRLVINLQAGLGEKDNDGVFQRTFSALFLAEIINHDNRRVFLNIEEVFSIFEKSLTYLEEEQDVRGFLPGKGWAHALAHTADLLFVLASNRFLTRVELEKLLDAIAHKVTQPLDWIFAYDEDDRLARVVIAANQRQLLDEFFMKQWLGSMTTARQQGWKHSYESHPTHMAYFNTRNFLRGLYLRMMQTEKMFNRDFLLQETMTAITNLRQF